MGHFSGLIPNFGHFWGLAHQKGNELTVSAMCLKIILQVTIFPRRDKKKTLKFLEVKTGTAQKFKQFRVT